MNMEVYLILKKEGQRKFDAMVTGLLLRGKTLLQAVEITEKAIVRKHLSQP